jgi:hypothetical protein
VKYLYVLVSDKNDYYYEQALLSITSLKMRMPDSFVSLLIDDLTEKTFIDKRHDIIELVNELKVIKIEAMFNKKARSRWLKTSMRQHIEGDFLFIDCDTVITDNLDNIFDKNINLAAVLDLHKSDHTKNTIRMIQKRIKILKLTSFSELKNYFNSGVIFCRDIPVTHEFFSEWHKLWLISFSKGILEDQAGFNQVNYLFNNIIAELDGIWNCQIDFGGISYFLNAKIIHYFISMYGRKLYESSYLLASISIAQNIKEKGLVSKEIKEMLKYPKLLNNNTRLIADKRMLTVINSRLFAFLVGTCKNDNKSFIINCIDYLILPIISMKEIIDNISKKIRSII